MTKQKKNIKMLDLLVKDWKLRVWCSLFHFFQVICKISNFNMWTAKHLALASCTELTLLIHFSGDDLKEKQIVMEQNCTQFKDRFSKDEFVFGEDDNTTFYIHVYDFEPPLWIIISFSQHPKLDLLQFFITFST